MRETVRPYRYGRVDFCSLPYDCCRVVLFFATAAGWEGNKETMDDSTNPQQPHQPHMIKLISAEGHEFFVNRKCAMVSGTIKAMLSGSVVIDNLY